MTRAEIRKHFQDAHLIEGETISLVLQNKGYDLPTSNDRTMTAAFRKFERSNYKKSPEMGRFGYDFRAVTRVNQRIWFFQIACFGESFNDIDADGSYLDWFGANGPEHIDARFPAIGEYFRATGKFELRRIPKDDAPDTLGPQIVLFHPTSLEIIDPKAFRSPAQKGQRKAVNKANAERNRKAKTKAKARTGRSIKNAT